MQSRLYNFFVRFIMAVGAVTSLFLAVSSVLIHGHLNNDSHELMHFIKNGTVTYVLTGLMLVALFIFRNHIKRINPLHLFIACALVYAVAGALIIAAVPSDLRGDAYMIYKYAKNFLKGDYEGLTGKYYLRLFPYQLGMLTYEMGLLKIWYNAKIFFSANLIFIIGTQLLMWRIAKNVFEDKEAENYAILLGFGFAPMLFYELFAYGCVPGHFFMALAGLFLTKYCRKGLILNAILCGLSLAVAIIFKPNYLIAAMAAAIVIFLYLIMKKCRYGFVVAILVFVLALVPNTLFAHMWRNISGIDFDGGAPYSLNVVMGLMPMDKGTGRLGGWYNGYNFATFEESNYDVKKSKDVSNAYAKELINYWIDNPKEAVLFFRDKIWSTWCDPLFQSLWSGPLEDSDQFVENRIVRSFFTGGHAAIFTEYYMSAFIILLYGGVFVACCSSFVRGHMKGGSLFLLLVFIGGLLFHLISETKSQYVYMYAYGLTLLEAGTFSGYYLKKSRK